MIAVLAARQGEVVNIGQAIVSLINPDDLWVRADVEETYIDRIRLGDRMTVRLPSGVERVGTVFYRGVDADYATQRDVSRTKRDIKTFEVRLRVGNSDRRLWPGLDGLCHGPLDRPAVGSRGGVRKKHNEERKVATIEVEDIRKCFNGFCAVDGLSFTVEHGEVFGLLGPNGAGKSTLIRMLTTLLPPTSGTARVNGFDVVESPDAVRRCIGVIPQAMTSDLDLTAARTCTSSPNSTASPASAGCGL